MKPAIASIAATVSASGECDGHREDVEVADRRGGSGAEGGKPSRYARLAPRVERALTLEVAAREYIWLYDHRRGVNCKQIAAREKVSVDRVRFGVKRAAALDNKHSRDDLTEHLRPGRLGDIGFRLLPLFPIGSFTPQSTCPHREPIGRGSSLCCMVCHASGMDDHPGLRRDPDIDPSPEPEPAPAPGASELKASCGPQETRRQRRRRQFAEAAAVA